MHCASKKITSQNSGIIMEDIKGIRKLYRKGNGQGKRYRSKMNSWSFYELQRQIEYKARWLGLLVTYVKARGTSSKCAICGSKLVPEEHRKMYCTFCNTSIDRDTNAACNILFRGTRVVPDGITGEAVMTKPDSKELVICRVDVIKSSDRVSIPQLDNTLKHRQK